MSLLGINVSFRRPITPQTDGQTKVVNRSLGNLVHCLVDDYLHSWDINLPIAEFTYYSVVHRSIALSPFQVILGYQPRKLIYSDSIPHYTNHTASIFAFTQNLSGSYVEVQHQVYLSKIRYQMVANEHYRPIYFEVGELVMV